MVSTSLLSQSISHPSKLQTGADFSHLSCTIFSEDSVNNDDFLDGHHIVFKEFGNGTFNEGSILLKHGQNQKCETLLKFKMRSNTRIAKVISKISSKNPACKSGAIAIGELFGDGFIFRQSLKNHARFSLEVIGMNSELCENGPIYLEFFRTR